MNGPDLYRSAILLSALALVVVMAGRTVRDFLRLRNQMRLDIAMMFVALAGGLVFSNPMVPHQLHDVGQVLSLAHPYLLFRLIDYFYPLSARSRKAALAACLASIATFLLFEFEMLPVHLVPAASKVILYYVLIVDLYAAGLFARGARRMSGVTHWRLALASLASVLIAGAVLPTTVRLFWPMAGRWLEQMQLVCLAGSTFCYLLAFTPPAWLRQSWRLAELQWFLHDGIGRSVQQRVPEMIERLLPAAAQVVGGVAAAAALWDEESQKLRLHTTNPQEAEALYLSVDTGAIARAWHERQHTVAVTPADMGEVCSNLCRPHGAGMMLSVPISTEERNYGVLLVFLRHGSLFPEEDATLLGLLAEQFALALSNVVLFEEQRTLAEQLQEQGAHLTRAGEIKSEFLANMSHELRTPLNAIIGFSEILLNKELPVDPTTKQQFQENILTSGRHLLSLINDILDLSKVEAGKMELHPEELAVADLLQGVHALAAPLAEKKAQQLELTVDPAVTRIHHDPSRFKQVVYNLLSNAVKFTPNGGRISTRAGLGPDGWLEVSVSDTGIGIKPEHLGSIFEEFKQIDSGYARHQQGTGLGLALVRRFVTLMGGDVTVLSESGVGSTFTLRLPIAQGTARDDDSLPTGTGPLVLVVEDDPAAASLLAFHISRGGYRVERAATAAQALDKARRLRPAAITLDIILPREDGYHVLHELKREVSTRDIPVVVISVVDDARTALDAGATEHLIKPVQPERLLATLHNLAKGAA